MDDFETHRPAGSVIGSSAHAPPVEPTPTPTTLTIPSAAAPEEIHPLSDDSRTVYLAVFDDHLWRTELPEGTYVVGRSKSNHLTLQDSLLSRKHCSFTYEDGELWVADLNSSNGTFVNGERIGTRRLQQDDIVELGQTVIVIFDGDSWKRGEGLVDLRNPVKAQRLVQRLDDATVERAAPPVSGSTVGGIRDHKGLGDRERAFLEWLESRNDLVPELIADYALHKLVSLFIRTRPRVREAFTQVMESSMDPELLARCEDLESVRRELVARARDALG